ncbi:hypothetical protein SAMN05519103_09421 [Rhizobiales bacterium GAS113]|nr:hypothetical protein SAMN05519103_09421 [Rhizobiales bacterium GAS113]
MIKPGPVLSSERPYAGLRPYDFPDHDYFFGRDDQTYALYRLIDVSRFIAVVGSSGAGKSSLVRAGLLPLLEEESQGAGGRSWRWISLRPGSAPLDRLADAIASLATADDPPHVWGARRDRIAFALRLSSFGLADALDELSPFDDNTSLLLVVDQFEELIRYSGSDARRGRGQGDLSRWHDEAAHFVRLLLEIARNRARSVHVLITMRSDFIGDCARFQGLPEAVSGTQFLVPSLTRDQLEEIICKPVKKAGASIDPALIERLIIDSGDDPDFLPVLQHCLARLWEQAPRTDPSTGKVGHDSSRAGEEASTSLTGVPHLDIPLYKHIGGLAEALSRHADDILLSVPDGGLAVEQVFRALAEIDKEGRATRRALPFTQLVNETGLPAYQVRDVVDRFRADDDCSFLVPSLSVTPKLASNTIVDVGHEALLRRWRRIDAVALEGTEVGQVGWLRAEEEDGNRYRMLALAATRKVTRPVELAEEDWAWWHSRPHPEAWTQRYGGGRESVQRLLEENLSVFNAEKERKADEARRAIEREEKEHEAEARAARKAEALALDQLRQAEEARRAIEREEKEHEAEARAARKAEALALDQLRQKADWSSVKGQAAGSDIPLGSRPPKPRLAMRVGFAGHRPNKLRAAEEPRIRRQLSLVFAAIDAAAQEILADNASFYCPEPPTIRIASGFAEGADQMAVVSCPDHWTIEAVLPFPREEFLKDIEKSALGDGGDARDEFLRSLSKAETITQLPMPQFENRDQGYIIAGSYLLRQIDVLVVVWDGKLPRPGGTGALAEEAFNGGIPVVWLSSLYAEEPSLIVKFEADGTPVSSHDDCTQGPLLASLRPIFNAPGITRRGPGQSTRGLDDFYLEHWRPSTTFVLFDALKRLANRQRLRAIIRTGPFYDLLRHYREDKFIEDAPTEDLRRRVQDILLPRLVWADALAAHFSNKSRSAYMMTYLLAAIAVLISIMGAFFESVHIRAVLGMMGLSVIGAIGSTIVLGRRMRLQERWFDYRTLAESLRRGRLLAFVSEFGRIQAAALHLPELPWTLWYSLATMREIGLPTATLDGIYQWKLLNAMRNEINERRLYLRLSMQGANRIDHMLHNFGLACFFLTFVAWLLFLIVYSINVVLSDAFASRFLADLSSNALQPLMVLFTAGLPALGAAFAGIRVHGDFEGSAERSARMLESLDSLTAEYDDAMQRDPRLDDTTQLIIDTARAMSEDPVAWQQLYGRKRLALPA